MNELKPPLTYSEQIDRLINVHGLQIEDRKRAEEILRNTNYYRLSAYGIGLRKKDDPEKYSAGITIEMLYRLYKFDSELRNAVAQVIEPIEIQFRSHMAYFLAMKYGADGYLNPANFRILLSKDKIPIHSEVIRKLNIERSRQINNPFVVHHEAKYGGKYPVWAAVELFTFSNLSSLYNVLIDEDRAAIAKLYNTSSEYLKSWIPSLVEVRNICAHYGRLYNMPLKQSPHLYSEYKQYGKTKINKLFPVILTIQRILCANADWVNFSIRLESIMDEYNDVVKLSFIGFPQNWKEVLKL